MGKKDSWQAVDVSVRFMRYGNTNGWSIDVDYFEPHAKKHSRLPIASGVAGAPLPPEGYQVLLETLSGLIDSSIALIIEPF